MSSTGQALNGRIVIGCAALFIAVVAIFLLSILVFFAGTGLREMHRQARLMDAAVQVEATIVSSEVVRSVHTVGTGTTSTGRSAARQEFFAPRIVFTYEIDGRPMRGDRLYPTPKGGDERSAIRMTTRYRPGTTVTAWVDPEHPADAFLQRQWVLGPYGMILGAAVGLDVLMAIGAVITFLWSRLSRAAALIGVSGGLLGPLYAGWHYWANPCADLAAAADAHRADEVLLGAGALSMITVIVLVAASVPLLGWAQGRRWRRRLASEDTTAAS